MDRARQMPNSNEHQNSSDDLIAELARLMAEEAQGERDAAEAKQPPAVEPQPVPEPKPAEPAQRLPESGNVVRIPGGRPSSESSAPEGSIWGRALDTSSAANSDDKPAIAAEEPMSVTASAPEPVPEAPVAPAPFETRSHPEPEETPRKPLFSHTQPPEDEGGDPLIAGAAEPNFLSDPPMPSKNDGHDEPNPFDTGKISLNDPIAELIAEEERAEAETARAEPVFPSAAERAEPAPERVEPAPFRAEPPASEPAPAPQPSAFAESRPTPQTPRHVQPAPQAPKPAAASDLDDDVLSLLRAMNTSEPAAAPVKKPSADDDTFSSAPILGLGASKPAESADKDPLDEIESLIGDAVRLSHDKHPQAPATPEVEPDFDDAALAAEAAIAAATAETARPVRVPHKPEPAMPDFEARLDRADAVGRTGAAEPTAAEAPKQPNNRLIVGVAAAATLLVAAALGLFFMFGMPGDTGGEIPVIASNTVDAKEEVVPGTSGEETTQPAIFDELDGGADTPPADEQIVSRDQSDTVSEDVRQVATAETADEGLANRKVRTVTVRPDGTIVSSDDTVAASEILPVTRPDVPALSTGTGAADDFQVTTTPAGTTAAAALDSAATDTVAAAGTAADPLAAIVESATAEANGEVVANAPFPAPRPADLTFATATTPAATGVTQPITTTTAPAAGTTGGDTIDLIAGVANQVASQLPTATTTASAPAPTSVATTPAVSLPATGDVDAPAYVQLSSQRSEAAAQSTLSIITDRYAGLFNGADAFVRQVDLGERGIYYRVLVPANSPADANGVCASVKAAGGDCFVRNN